MMGQLAPPQHALDQGFLNRRITVSTSVADIGRAGPAK
jgi:hypothetical protein